MNLFEYLSYYFSIQCTYYSLLVDSDNHVLIILQASVWSWPQVLSNNGSSPSNRVEFSGLSDYTPTPSLGLEELNSRWSNSILSEFTLLSISIGIYGIMNGRTILIHLFILISTLPWQVVESRPICICTPAHTLAIESYFRKYSGVTFLI